MLTGQARMREIMNGPISRQEAMAMEDRIMANILSCATAIEAAENLLVARGILKDDELMTEVKAVLEKKTEQAQAAVATSSLVTEV